MTLLPRTPLGGGSGMRKTCNRVHLCPAGAGENRPFLGVAAAPPDLRARADRQVRRPQAAQLRIHTRRHRR